MNDHLCASELADLVGCKVNQRARMATWLDKNHWRYAVDSSGLPKVARAYYNRKMGVTEDKMPAKYADTPNFQIA
jgi:hypothetical protein